MIWQGKCHYNSLLGVASKKSQLFYRSCFAPNSLIPIGHDDVITRQKLNYSLKEIIDGIEAIPDLLDDHKKKQLDYDFSFFQYDLMTKI